jgi:hypothetical protein
MGLFSTKYSELAAPAGTASAGAVVALTKALDMACPDWRSAVRAYVKGTPLPRQNRNDREHPSRADRATGVSRLTSDPELLFFILTDLPSRDAPATAADVSRTLAQLRPRVWATGMALTEGTTQIRSRRRGLEGALEGLVYQMSSALEDVHTADVNGTYDPLDVRHDLVAGAVDAVNLVAAGRALQAANTQAARVGLPAGTQAALEGQMAALEDRALDMLAALLHQHMMYQALAADHRGQTAALEREYTNAIAADQALNAAWAAIGKAEGVLVTVDPLGDQLGDLLQASDREAPAAPSASAETTAAASTPTYAPVSAAAAAAVAQIPDVALLRAALEAGTSVTNLTAVRDALLTQPGGEYASEDAALQQAVHLLEELGDRAISRGVVNGLVYRIGGPARAAELIDLQSVANLLPGVPADVVEATRGNLAAALVASINPTDREWEAFKDCVSTALATCSYTTPEGLVEHVTTIAPYLWSERPRERLPVRLAQAARRGRDADRRQGWCP